MWFLLAFILIFSESVVGEAMTCLLDPEVDMKKEDPAKQAGSGTSVFRGEMPNAIHSFHRSRVP